MHVALTGASGFIGSFLLGHLRAAGHTITALVRAGSRRDHIAPFVDTFVTGDQADERAWPALLDGAACVIHNTMDWEALRAETPDRHLASNLVPAIRLLHRAAPRQFIFMSTIAVHHDMRPRWGGLVDEDHPTRPGTLYGAGKAAVEAHLWDAHFRLGLNACALRPCAVYGIDPRLERSIGYPIVHRVRRERRFARRGGGKFVHVADVAAATTAAVGNPDAAGRVYNLVDCYARWSDLATMAARIMGLEAEIDAPDPPQPKNTFARDAAATLGVSLDRGHEGLRGHMQELIERMDAADVAAGA